MKNINHSRVVIQDKPLYSSFPYVPPFFTGAVDYSKHKESKTGSVIQQAVYLSNY